MGVRVELPSGKEARHSFMGSNAWSLSCAVCLERFSFLWVLFG